MEAKLYYLKPNQSYQKVKKFMDENEIKYITQKTNEDPLTKEQFMEILSYTDNGVEDILSIKSGAYKVLIGQGIDFDELTLNEFYEMVMDYPALVKSPIVVAKSSVVIGYNEDSIGLLSSRKNKRELFQQTLRAAIDVQDDECSQLDDTSQAYVRTA